VVLSKKQKDILVGLLLGDGSLEFDGFKASRLQIKQAERKKEYVFWLYDQFTDLVRTPPKQRPDTRQWYFSTRSVREFEEYRKMFYPKGRKIIPLNIATQISSPVTIAVWFMDDGTLDYRIKSHYSFSFSTDAFSVKDVRLLQKILKEKFHIPSSIQTPSSRGTKYTKLYVGKDGREEFLRLIEPHILNCFAYKLPRNCYSLTPQRLISRV